ncbi:hypothetical protein AB0L71_20745 [Streptomyces sp. NPDC052052]|uniref:hypothetical protein n=1 Tax=Streptomyces sp. NPDC052052 TaxID=3154756 RepID=UPI0034347B01
MIGGELVGHWESRSGSSLVLRADGQFSAKPLHTDYVEGAGIKVVSEETVEGVGKWTLADYGAGHEVDLRFTGGGSVTLWVASLDGVKVMWAWVGDGESSVLKKQDS